MTFDFANFLPENTQIFFLKAFDIANLSISIIAIFIAIIAVMVSVPSEIQNNIKIVIELEIAVAFILISILSFLQGRQKTYNKNILKIQKTIIQNYNRINERNDRSEILDKFHVVLRKPTEQKIKEFEDFLSNSKT